MIVKGKKMGTGNRYCHKCGKILLPESRFCSFCGAKIENPAQINLQIHGSQQQNHYKMEAEKKQKNGNVAGVVLWIVIIVLISIVVITNTCIIEHNWQEATCDSPMTCSRCGKTTGVSIAHTWSKGTEDTPAKCTSCGKMRPMPVPDSGTVFVGEKTRRESTLTIISSSNKSCYIKLKDINGRDVFSFFVRAGEEVEVSVPSGKYYVYFAYGSDWYGTKELFGPDTDCAKDDELLDFSQYYYEYTLYPVTNGNFTETPIDISEF